MIRCGSKAAAAPSTALASTLAAPPTPKPLGEWLTTEEAAVYLGLKSRKAVYEMVRRGHFEAHRLGPRLMRFRRTELDQVFGKGRP